MSEIDILQKSFMDSMQSMQNEYKKEKELLEKKIMELIEENNKLKKDKEAFNEMFKQNLNSNSEEITKLQNINRDLTKQINETKTKNEELKEYKNKYDEINNQIEFLKKNEIKLKQENEELKKSIEKKDSEISDLNEKIKKNENLKNELLEHIKKSKEDEDKRKLEDEKWKKEKEQFEKYKKEEEKKIEITKEKNSEMSIEKKNKFLIDILCEFLLKLNNSQYILTVFDLLNKSLKKFDELNYFAKMSLRYNHPINDILFNFFSNLRSYIILRKEDASLKNFLTQKTFKYSELDKDDIETLKMIRTVNLGEGNNLLDLYKKKKDLFFQKVELTFDLIKNKIISDDEKDKKENTNKNNNIEFPDILNIKEPPTKLDINFDKLNIAKLSLFVSFQINNIFSKLENLNIEVSKVNLDIFYSIVFNCLNLKSVSIKLNNKNLENNIVILNNIIPIIFNYNKSLKELSYYNIPLLNKFLPLIVASIKSSKLEKLSLSGCFSSKVDFAMFNSYFTEDNYLTEIDFSFNNFNIPSLLSNSLLNFDMNKKLISINFSNCDLSDDDINIIVKYIEDNPLMKFCDISNNNLSQKSCFKLGAMLEKNTTLEKINLNNCNLTGENIMPICSNKGSKGLRHIILNNNPIEDLGLIGISGFIKNSTKLEILEMNNIKGNDMGFITVINCLKNTETLKKIYFEKNKITKKSIDMIKKSDEEFNQKGIKFYLNKIDDNKNEKNEEIINSIEYV